MKYLIFVLSAALAVNAAGGQLRKTDTLNAKGHRCFSMRSGEQSTVRSVNLRHRNASYVVAAPPGTTPQVVGKKALLATVETLLGTCDRKSTKGRDWVIDAGAGGGEIAALAGSLGCSVAAIDPREKDVWALRTTGCLNDDAGPFVVFQGVAAPETKMVKGLQRHTTGNVSNATKETLTEGIALDSIFSEKRADEFAVGGKKATANADWDAEVALLKITQRDCCDTSATLWALQGANTLFKHERVRCFMAEINFDRETTDEVFEELHEFEKQGFRLAHPGPLDSPHIEILHDGNYQLFDTDVKQLGEIYDQFLKIRSFDERTGYRAYSGGLSLDRDGRYFDYTDLVFGCRGRFPDELKVDEKANIRWKDGMWWPDAKTKVNA